MRLNNCLLLTKSKFCYKYYKTESNPFVKGNVLKTMIITPRKPNSARRSVVKVALVNRLKALVYIPGIGHNLRKHCSVLIRGGGAKDLPMVSYSCVRNKFDLNPVLNRVSRRSKYGVKLLLKKNM